MTSVGVRSLRTAAASILLASSVAAVGCSDDPAGPAEQEIVIGGLFSLTGNWASLGVASKAAMEIGIEDVNAYLAQGNSGLQFTASIKDTKLDPATALTGITAFKAAGVEVVLGPQSSAEVAAIKTFADANAVLVASQSSTAGTLAIAGDNIFRFTPSDTLEAVALVGLMKADGMTTIIPFWRNDAGNIGLQVATRALFGATGTKAGVQYAATQPDFAAAIASLKTQVQAAITERGGTTGVAVAHAGFDEVVDIFKLANADPVLSSVRWYGTDGTALTEPLRADATAAAFARKVSFWAPIPGVDAGASDRWQPIAARIAARASGAQPDAFALAVYDAVWVTAEAYLAAGGRGHAASLKTSFVTAANNFYGASGWTALNAAGDRRFGDFDFFALSQTGTTSAWSLRAQYDTQRRVLTRMP